MTTKEIAQSVLTLRNKGYVSDYGDTDYFCDATEDEVDLETRAMYLIMAILITSAMLQKTK